MIRCAGCGHRFRPHRRRGRIFCSAKCRGFTLRRRLFRPCAGCDAIMVGPLSHMTTKQFCSRQCRHQATQITYRCESCGQLRTVSRHQTAKRFCGDVCRLAWFSKAFVGDASPQWLGGSIVYYGPSWRNARRLTRERDGYCCRECGVSEADLPERLSVAHVVPFRAFGLDRHEEANDLTNLRSLCRQCHLIFDRANGTRKNLNLERTA